MLGQQSFPSYIQFPTIGPQIPPKLIPLAVLTSTPHPVGPGTPTMPILKGKKKPIYHPSTPGGAQPIMSAAPGTNSSTSVEVFTHPYWSETQPSMNHSWPDPSYTGPWPFNGGGSLSHNQEFHNCSLNKDLTNS
jgi:hypothetical protein